MARWERRRALAKKRRRPTQQTHQLTKKPGMFLETTMNSPPREPGSHHMEQGSREKQENDSSGLHAGEERASRQRKRAYTWGCE